MLRHRARMRSKPVSVRQMMLINDTRIKKTTAMLIGALLYSYVVQLCYSVNIFTKRLNLLNANEYLLYKHVLKTYTLGGIFYDSTSGSRSLEHFLLSLLSILHTLYACAIFLGSFLSAFERL